MAVAPATRRAHSHRPGLCSDKWGASCPDVWSRGRRASPRQRGSCLGRRRSDGGPGPTKPVQPLSPPQRGASPLACTYPPPPHNPPPTKPSRSDRQRPIHPSPPPLTSFPHPPNVIPAKAGIHREGRRPSPHMAVAPAPPARKGGPHARRWTQTRPCWRSCNVPPPGATPLLAYLRKTPPGPTGPARDPGRSQSKENHPTASARVPSPGNNCCFTPRPASKTDKKTQSNLTQGD